jgi:hypothetical protein
MGWALDVEVIIYGSRKTGKQELAKYWTPEFSFDD